MDEKYIFLSEGVMNILRDEKVSALNSLIADNYVKRLREINNRHEWKKTGAGARFMGNVSNMNPGGINGKKPCVSGVVSYGNGKVLYSLNTENIGGLYEKDISNPNEPESYILVKEKTGFFDIDLGGGINIVATVSDSHLERHLALIDIEKKDFTLLTEGESSDGNPVWSRRDKHIIYYDSCGLGFDGNQNFIKFGPKSVLRLNIETGDLTEILASDNFDFYKPYENISGDLFYIKRPYNQNKKKSMTPNDILLIPVKVLKAIFGWLNFFTQRYAGESLKTAGSNPAKAQTDSHEQRFIDGNLLDVEKNLKQNELQGEKNPGYAPLSWELNMRSKNGEERLVKRGVLDYCVLADGSIAYSNGKYILKLNETGNEEVLAKVQFASGIRYLENL